MSYALFNPCQPCCESQQECCSNWQVPILYGIFHSNDKPFDSYETMPTYQYEGPEYPPTNFLLAQDRPGDKHWYGAFTEYWQQQSLSHFDCNLICQPSGVHKNINAYELNVIKDNTTFFPSGYPNITAYDKCINEFTHESIAQWELPGTRYQGISYPPNLFVTPGFYPQYLQPTVNRKLVAKVTECTLRAGDPRGIDITGQQTILTWGHSIYEPVPPGYTNSVPIGRWGGVFSNSSNVDGQLYVNLYTGYSSSLAWPQDYAFDNIYSLTESQHYTPNSTTLIGFAIWSSGTYTASNLFLPRDTQWPWTSISVLISDPNLNLQFNGSFVDGPGFPCSVFNNVNVLTLDSNYYDWAYNDNTYYINFYGSNIDSNGNYGIRCDFGIKNQDCKISYLLKTNPYDFDPGQTYTLNLLQNGLPGCSGSEVPSSIILSPKWI
jgi:hypothetical protein